MSKSKKGEDKVTKKLGKGLDVGTAFFVAAEFNENDEVVTSKIRDAFISLDVEAKKMLKLSNVSFVEKGNEVLIIGDNALNVANIFKEFTLRRPLSKGIISADEMYAFDVVGLMIKELLGEPTEPGEVCCFSVPANPLDLGEDDGRDVIYHQAIFSRLVSECGYTARPFNEAMAVVYSELEDTDYTGIALSYGAGQTNCCLSFKSIEGLKFSVARGGDWIDQKSARAVGSKDSRICKIKERGDFDLLDPMKGGPRNFREREALQVHYKSLILYTLDKIASEFIKVQDHVELPEAIPIVVSGGTTKATGFIELFNAALKEIQAKRVFPIEISEVRHAKDPLGAVAKGLLVLAMNEEGDEQ